MNTEIKIDKWDRDGAYGVILETKTQGPILLETEGADSSYEAAESRAGKAFGGGALRYCIVRLVPVGGNELLPLDMQRMQK